MCRALAGTGFVHYQLRRRAGRPQLKRDPLGAATKRFRIAIYRSRFLIPVIVLACSSGASAQRLGNVVPHAPGRSSRGTRYLFYLHGRIVEDRGPAAVSPDFGPYQYLAIVDAFADSGFAVVSEVRAPDTDVQAYADSVIRQVRRLVATGALPSDVTVVGASKGAVIAMLVATKLPVAGLRFVLLGNCNDAVQSRFPLHLHGDVLSIYEASDSIGHSCVPIFEQSPALGRRQELRLESGLGHGFLFRPLGAWVGPAVAWARRGGA